MMFEEGWHTWGGHMFSWWSAGIMFLLILAVIAVIVRSKNRDQGPDR